MPDARDTSSIVKQLQRSLDGLQKTNFLKKRMQNRAPNQIRSKKCSDKELTRMKIPVSASFICLIDINSC